MRFNSWVWMTNHIVHPRFPSRLADKHAKFDPNETYTKVRFIDGNDGAIDSELTERGQKDAIEIDFQNYSISRHWAYQARFYYNDGTSVKADIMAIRVGELKSGKAGPETGKLAFRLHDGAIQKVFEGRDGSDGKSYPMDLIDNIEITKFIAGANGREARMLNNNIHLLSRESKASKEEAEKEEKPTDSVESDKITKPSSTPIESSSIARETEEIALSVGENGSRGGRNAEEPPEVPRRFIGREESPSPICFAKGTMILLEGGETLVENLNVGDLVVTKDHNAQPIRWIGKRSLDEDELAHNPKFRPIRISAGALGYGNPRRDLTVSPQHRILVCCNYAQMLTGSEEVLVPAKKLTDLPGINTVNDLEEVEYYHILLDRHELIYGNGTLAESFYLSEYSLTLIKNGALDSGSKMIKNPEPLMKPARPFVTKNKEVQRLIRDLRTASMEVMSRKTIDVDIIAGFSMKSFRPYNISAYNEDYSSGA